ncbi:Unconventional myosin-XVI [Branchiostoma belcheri]|nr:Unconventional myosin-XVI [Branchiostoma belcheri]
MDGDEFRRAVEEGDVQTVRRGLLAGRDVNQRFTWRWPWDNRTALHVASVNGKTGVVKLLIQHGADVEARNEADRTALHWASGQGQTGVVKLLIQHGADLEARDNDDRTALHWASRNGYTRIVELLIQHGADVGARDKNDRTALHVASLYEHTGVVELLIQHGADVGARDKNGKAIDTAPTAPNAPPASSCKPVFFLEKDVHAVSPSETFFTNVEVYKAVARRVQASNIAGIQQVRGLWRRYLRDPEERASLIASGISLLCDRYVEISDNHPFQQRNGVRITVRDVPLSVNDGVLASGLKSYGAKLLGPLKREMLRVDGKLTNCETGDRFAFMAIPTNPTEHIPRFVELGGRWRARVFYRDQPKDQARPRHVPNDSARVASTPAPRPPIATDTTAGNEGSSNEQQSRLAPSSPEEEDHRDRPEQSQVNRGKQSQITDYATPTTRTRNRGRPQSQTTKKTTAPTVATRSTTKKNQSSTTTSSINTDEGDDQAAIMRQRIGDLVETSRNAASGTHIDTPGNFRRDGRTALHWASLYGQTGVVKLLIQHGADVGARDEDGETALHWASVNGHTGVVKLLIQHGADVGARNKDGETALHRASGNGQTGVVELLVQHGADVGARGEDGETALHWASVNGHTGVVKLLIQLGADVGARDKIGKTPLDYVHDQDRRRFLKNLAVEVSYHKLMKQSGGLKVDRVKLCFCGPQEAGKSTLMESLQTGPIVAFFRDRMTPDDQPHEPTPGVNVGTANIPGVGQVSVWDFAGQSEYAVTHSMFMDAENTIFIVLYNIMVDLKKQKRERWQRRHLTSSAHPHVKLSRLLLHCPVAVSHSHMEGSRQADVVHWWLCFIKSCNTKSKPHVILAASHADQTDTGHQRASFILELMTSEFKNHMNISNKVFLLDCRKTRKTDMRHLKDLLTILRTDLLEHQRAIPKLCAEIIKCLPKWAKVKCSPKCPVFRWAEYKEAVKEIDRFVDEDFLKTSSQYLDHLGEILFVPLQNADPIIVLKPNWLCTDVFGKVMAPDDFPIQHLKTSEGEDVDVVTKEEIQRVFQDVADVDLLITLLQEFQLCHTYDRKEFIIPGLLTQSMPPEKWQPTANPAKTIYFGKQVQCADTTDMFSSAFFPRVQTRLMRELKNRPLLWRDGAKCFDSNVESLIKLSPDGRAVNICVRSEQGDKLSCRQMLEKIENILINVLDEVSPGTTTEERVLSARALKEHREEIHSYSKDQINKAKAEDGSVHHGILGFSEDVDDLLCDRRDDEEEQGAVGYSHQEPRVYEMHNHIINAGDGAVINMYQGATGQLEQLQLEGDVGQLQLEGDVGQPQLEGNVGQLQLEDNVSETSSDEGLAME